MACGVKNNIGYLDPSSFPQPGLFCLTIHMLKPCQETSEGADETWVQAPIRRPSIWSGPFLAYTPSPEVAFWASELGNERNYIGRSRYSSLPQKVLPSCHNLCSSNPVHGQVLRRSSTKSLRGPASELWQHLASSCFAWASIFPNSQILARIRKAEPNNSGFKLS